MEPDVVPLERIIDARLLGGSRRRINPMCAAGEERHCKESRSNG
jgi:hypothetical protein